MATSSQLTTAAQATIFVGSGYLTQRELYRLALLTTLFCLAVFRAFLSFSTMR